MAVRRASACASGVSTVAGSCATSRHGRIAMAAIANTMPAEIQSRTRDKGLTRVIAKILRSRLRYDPNTPTVARPARDSTGNSAAIFNNNRPYECRSRDARLQHELVASRLLSFRPTRPEQPHERMKEEQPTDERRQPIPCKIVALEMRKLVRQDQSKLRLVKRGEVPNEESRSLAATRRPTVVLRRSASRAARACGESAVGQPLAGGCP